jgi:DNA-binding transcriptional LysR family regulator
MQKLSVPENETLVGDVLDLQAFVLAADLRSLSATAKRMGESTATASRRIARLEAALGVSLLHRLPRGVAPTDDGLAYRVRVTQILELLGDANGAIRRAHEAPAGHLRVTAPPGSESFLAPLFAQFMQAFPEVIVSVLVTERFVDLEAEHIDVALRATSKLADSSLVAHRLMDLELVAVAAPDYLNRHATPKRVGDLAQHRIVQLGQARANASVSVQRVDGSGEAIELRLPYRIAATDMGFAKGLVVAAAGIALLPRFIMQRELEEGRLIHLLRAHEVRGPALWLLHRAGRFLPSKVRAFREFMLEPCKRQAIGNARRKPQR